MLVTFFRILYICLMFLACINKSYDDNDDDDDLFSVAPSSDHRPRPWPRL